MSAWDPIPLARAVLADHEAPPVLFLAAWRCLFRGDCERLTDLALKAAGQPEPRIGGAPLTTGAGRSA